MTNSAVKRIQKEITEIQAEASELYSTSKLGGDIFTWHFTIAGLKETEFEGGIYHGVIKLDYEYPLKAPKVILTTANGRFQVNQRICLSITPNDPTDWNPGMSIRNVLMSIIGEFSTEDKSLLGYLDYSKEERAKFAKESVNFVCPDCKMPNRCLLNSANSNGCNASYDLMI